jgi:hypothetical protein
MLIVAPDSQIDACDGLILQFEAIGAEGPAIFIAQPMGLGWNGVDLVSRRREPRAGHLWNHRTPEACAYGSLRILKSTPFGHGGC